jgi:hypothetical protein
MAISDGVLPRPPVENWLCIRYSLLPFLRDFYIPPRHFYAFFTAFPVENPRFKNLP